MNQPIELTKVQMNGEVTVTISYKCHEQAPKPDDELIKKAVDRFLCWQLPRDFHPDNFIHFDKYLRESHGGESANPWPTGTNLLTADQARAMFEHCLRKDGK